MEHLNAHKVKSTASPCGAPGVWGNGIPLNKLTPWISLGDSQDIACTLEKSGSTNIEQPILELPTHSCRFRMNQVWSEKYFDCKGLQLKHSKEATRLKCSTKKGMKEGKGNRQLSHPMVISSHHLSSSERNAVLGLRIIYYSFFFPREIGVLWEARVGADKGVLKASPSQFKTYLGEGSVVGSETGMSRARTIG